MNPVLARIIGTFGYIGHFPVAPGTVASAVGVGLAFVLFNLYITLRQNLSSALKKPLESPKRFWLSLRRLALMLARSIERLWGIADVLQLQPCVTFS